MIFLKEGYNSAETTKVLHVSLLKVICVDPKFLEPPRFSIYTTPKIGQPTVFYHTADYLSTDYEYSDDYGHEISGRWKY